MGVIDYSGMTPDELASVRDAADRELSRRLIPDGIEGMVRQYHLLGGDLPSLRSRLCKQLDDLLAGAPAE